MDNNPPNAKNGLAINTPLQKKSDQNIQFLLNKYKNVEENPELKLNTGKDYDIIISHKSTIPDLVIYNKVFNKNECFCGANLKENNYFPRFIYYIKFDEKEKLQSRVDNELENNNTNEGNKKGEEEEEESEGDDELEEEEDDDELGNQNNINNNDENKENNENLNKINEYSDVEGTSNISINNSMLKDIDFLPNNNNQEINNQIKSPDLFNQSRTNFMDNSINYEELNNTSYNSSFMNNIKNIIENQNDSSQLSFYPKNYGNIENTNDMSTAYNSENINSKNNKIQNMFIRQNNILNQIEQYEKVGRDKINPNILNGLKEKIIKLFIYDPFGNIIRNRMNFYEAFEYITKNVIKKNKKLEEYHVYIIDTEEQFEAKYFYMSILYFLRKIFKE